MMDGMTNNQTESGQPMKNETRLVKEVVIGVAQLRFSSRKEPYGKAGYWCIETGHHPEYLGRSLAKAIERWDIVYAHWSPYDQQPH